MTAKSISPYGEVGVATKWTLKDDKVGMDWLLMGQSEVK